MKLVCWQTFKFASVRTCTVLMCSLWGGMSGCMGVFSMRIEVYVLGGCVLVPMTWNMQHATNMLPSCTEGHHYVCVHCHLHVVWQAPSQVQLHMTTEDELADEAMTTMSQQVEDAHQSGMYGCRGCSLLQGGQQVLPLIGYMQLPWKQVNIISTTSSNVCLACTASCTQLHVVVWPHKGGHKAEVPSQTSLDAVQYTSRNMHHSGPWYKLLQSCHIMLVIAMDSQSHPHNSRNCTSNEVYMNFVITCTLSTEPIRLTWCSYNS